MEHYLKSSILGKVWDTIRDILILFPFRFGTVMGCIRILRL